MNLINKIIGDNAEESLLQRDESNAVKALLIFLIVLAHNKYLMQGGFSNRYLYSFHFYSFFLLTFLYNFKQSSLPELLLKKLKRYYVPYTIFFLLLTGIAFYQNRSLDLPKLALTWLCGSQRLFGASLGMGSFLWFIPTMFSLLVIRWMYYNSGKIVRIIMLLVSATCLIGFAYLLKPFIVIWTYAPFGSFIAMAMLLPGVICRYCFKTINPECSELLFFVLIIAIIIVYPLEGYGRTYLTINRLFCPIIIFLYILSMRHFLKSSKLLIDIGKNSFGIYLIHIFIYYACYMWLDRVTEPGIYIGLALFCATFALSYLIAKIPIVKSVFNL